MHFLIWLDICNFAIPTVFMNLLWISFAFMNDLCWILTFELDKILIHLLKENLGSNVSAIFLLQHDMIIMVDFCMSC